MNHTNMKLNLTLKSCNIGNVRDWFILHRVYAMSSAGAITEIGWEPGTAEMIRIDANSIELRVENVWFRDLKTGKQLKTLDACCIVGIDVIDSEGAIFPVEHSIGPVWCSECTLSEGDDSYSFESDTSRNLWLYVKDAITENENSLYERYIEEIECAAHASFIQSAPSYVPHREDLRILFTLAKHYPCVNQKKTGAQL